jgi:hypothetical protein
MMYAGDREASDKCLFNDERVSLGDKFAGRFTLRTWRAENVEEEASTPKVRLETDYFVHLQSL